MGIGEGIILFETERLKLRTFTLRDAPFMYQLVNDPEWIKYIGDRHVRSITDAEQYLRNGALKSYMLNGFGPGLVILKETGESIGMCGLFRRPYLEDVDLGFAFLPAYRGQGFAYEIALATLEYAWKELGVKKVMAFTAKENEASLRLLKKLGFKDAGEFVLEGESLYLLSIP